MGNRSIAIEARIEELKELMGSEELLYADAYLQTLNGPEAIELSGIKGRTHRYFANRTLVKEYIALHFEHNAMGKEEVLSRLADIARGTMGDFTTVDEDGRFRLDLARAKRAKKMGLIKSWSTGKQGTKIELYNAQDALNSIGKHLGLFADKVDPKSQEYKVMVEYVTGRSKVADNSTD